MASGLEHLLAEGVISEVIARLQSGKEAEVYVVRFGGNVVAAKVYKDRAHRSFKNNAVYKEGRTVRSSRSQRAMDRGSKFGKAAAEDAWKAAEADALYKLHAAGVRVPTPVLYLDGVLLMELVMGPEGNAARRLIDTPISPAQANAAYHDLVGQLVRILSCDLIHGDLSPYNVLWGADGPTIIDFPQIISASHSSGSEHFFLRDADNILGYLARIDRSLQPRCGDPLEIWSAYRRRELTPEFRPSGQSRQSRQARPSGGRPRPALQEGGPPRHARPGAPQTHGPQARGNPPHGTSHATPGAAHAAPPPRRPQAFVGGPRRSVHVPEVIVRHAPHAPLAATPATPPARAPANAHAAPHAGHAGPERQPRPAPREGAPPAEDGAGAQPSRRRRRRRR